jgi:hypothetical protein
MIEFALLPGDDLSYESIAESLQPPVSKQAVSKGLISAGWPAVKEAVRCFEAVPWTASGTPSF